MRGTRHNGRGYKGSKNGYNPKHDDRDYELDEEQAKRESKNIYWNIYDGQYRGSEKQDKLSFADAEKKFYEENFKGIWETQKKKNEEAGHKNRNKSFDDWRTLKRYCPEESYMQIGNMDDENSPTDAEFTEIALDYLKWEDEWNESHGHPFTRLDYSFHRDEGMPQIHTRKVWTYTDENGDLQIGQEKALEKAGVSLPDETKKNSRYNNRKMAFDKLCREKFLDIAEEHGFSLDRKPVKDAKHNLSKGEYLRRKKTVEKRESDVEAREAAVAEREAKVADLQRFNDIFVEKMKTTHFDATGPSVYEVAYAQCGVAAEHDFREQMQRESPVKPLTAPQRRSAEDYIKVTVEKRETAVRASKSHSGSGKTKLERDSSKTRDWLTDALASSEYQKLMKKQDSDDYQPGS